MREDEVQVARLRAYQIWEGEGRPDGQHESHRELALKELGLLPAYEEDRSAVAEQSRKWDEEEGRS